MDGQKETIEERMDDIPDKKRPDALADGNEMLTEIIENKSGKKMDPNKPQRTEEKSDMPPQIPVMGGAQPEKRSYLSVYFIPLFSTVGLIIIVVSFIVFNGKPPAGPQLFRDRSAPKKTAPAAVIEENTNVAVNMPATNITAVQETGNLMPTNEAVQERQRETVKKMKAYVNEIKSGTKTYTVRYRDSLWDIAKQNYGGNGFYWVFIYALNVDTMKNPDILVTGSKITIPVIARDLLSTRLERIPPSVRSGLAESYYEIYEIYIAVNESEHAKWMLYLSDRFDSQIIEMSKGSLPRSDYDFILRARSREGR